jgi:hypothetical protein
MGRAPSKRAGGGVGGVSGLPRLPSRQMVHGVADPINEVAIDL